MKNVVMGTAGHIDHGKTALVKRLTGIDTDRLEEEKRRGMTIELGFAPLTLPSGNTISIIDVPGHEKFIKTMVAGATGIDFVMLVVAADEGVMPQTREHIDILSLLNVRSGVVALTKTDLVDAEWLEMVKEEVGKALAGTPLEAAPVVPVSSVTGAGIDELKAQLDQLTEMASKSADRGLFRLPIDRVFTMTGYGTVITGTLSGGKISRGETVEILPSGLTARVRGIQVHNVSVDSAGAGNRCALNLSGVEKADVERGDVVANPGIIKPVSIVDAVLHTVSGKEGVTHNQRVHVHTATKEVLARVRILGAEEIAAGGSGYVQLRFEEPVAVLRRDRFIIRSHSPVLTVGGGWVIYHATHNRQRFSKETTDALEIGEKADLKELVRYLAESSNTARSIDELWKELFDDRDEIKKALDEGVEEGSIIRFSETGRYLSKRLYNFYAEAVETEFQQLYKKYPYRYQIDREELKNKVFTGIEPKDFPELLRRYTEDRLFEPDGNFIIQSDRAAINRINTMKETGLVERMISQNGLYVKNNQQLQLDTGIEAQKFREIERFLVQTGRIADLGDDIFVHADVIGRSVEGIRKIIDGQGSASAAQARDLLGTGRKTAIALLEYLDGIGVTQRAGDVRKPGVRYNASVY